MKKIKRIEKVGKFAESAGAGEKKQEDGKMKKNEKRVGVIIWLEAKKYMIQGEAASGEMLELQRETIKLDSLVRGLDEKVNSEIKLSQGEIVMFCQNSQLFDGSLETLDHDIKFLASMKLSEKKEKILHEILTEMRLIKYRKARLEENLMKLRFAYYKNENKDLYL